MRLIRIQKAMRLGSKTAVCTICVSIFAWQEVHQAVAFGKIGDVGLSFSTDFLHSFNLFVHQVRPQCQLHPRCDVVTRVQQITMLEYQNTADFRFNIIIIRLTPVQAMESCGPALSGTLGSCRVWLVQIQMEGTERHLRLVRGDIGSITVC